MALLFHCRTTTKSKTFTITNSSLLRRLYSGDDQPPNKSNSPFSYFRDVKESLKQQKPSYPSSPTNPPTFTASTEETQKNLSAFRRHTETPPPTDPSSLLQISFQDLYKHNVFQKPPTVNSDLRTAKQSGKFSLDAIRKSLQNMKAESGGGDGKGTTLPAFKVPVRGMKRDGSSVESTRLKTEFVKMYGYVELGEKLRKLRLEGKGFSIGELNERLIRLREIEENESLSTVRRVSFTDLRESLSPLMGTQF